MITYLLALSIICSPASTEVEQAIKSYVESNFAVENAEFQYDFHRINWNLVPAELDSVTARDILRLFRRIVEEEQLTLLISSHDPLVDEFVDEILELKNGQIDQAS